MIYVILIYEFLKIGLFSIGGGLATLPFLYQAADRYPWFTHEMLTDMIAISQSTPGPIGLNMATYAGYTAAGAAGGVLASLAIVTPSLIIVSCLVKALDKFKENALVKAAFYGVRPAVTALIASAAFGIVRLTLLDLSGFADTRSLADLFNYRRLALFAGLFYLMRKYNRHPAFYIGAGALAGVLLKL
ncbi:MAG: chromate transporter [Synergistaceae bacterium]|jgi:chromate transporter|nr:chromate transporter [Synergistaceae bacterium]